MDPMLLFLFPLLLLTPPSACAAASSLDPKQLKALQSLGVPTSRDPCSTPPSTCDTAKPFRHLLSLTLSDCSSDVSLSSTALKSLSTLRDLRFSHCPAPPIRFPPELASSLKSFSCVSSLRRLTGVWLSKLQNLTDLTVSDVPISASGPSIILSGLRSLQSITISNANLSGYLPKSWHHNITRIDLSANNLKGRIHSSISALDSLVSLNLSSNQLSGEIPDSIGDLIDLQNLSLSSNSLSGSIPDSLSAASALAHLDLSSNHLNGSIPGFLADMKGLKYLNLEGNSFQGVMPFNASFIKKLTVFKIGENGNLCYNRATISSKVKLGIAPCDKNGLPMSPPAKSPESGTADESDYSDSSDNLRSQNSSAHHGPNKVVLGIAIAFASIIFLIIFLIFLSKRCA